MGRAIDRQTLIDLIIDAKRTDPETGSFTEWLADYLSEHLPTLPQPAGWVSVEERLPENDPTIKKHMEMDKFGFLTVLVYNGTVKQTNRFFCNAPNFGLPKTDGWEWASINVTHWMPLPTPPEGEADA